MRALVKAAAEPGFELRDVPRPAIRDNEVLIRVRRAGVCGTDVHIYDWDAWAQGRCHPPFTVGHEFAGDVVASPAYTVTPVLQRCETPTSLKFSSKTAEPMFRKFFTAKSPVRREAEVRSIVLPRSSSRS